MLILCRTITSLKLFSQVLGLLTTLRLLFFKLQMTCYWMLTLDIVLLVVTVLLDLSAAMDHDIVFDCLNTVKLLESWLYTDLFPTSSTDLSQSTLGHTHPHLSHAPFWSNYSRTKNFNFIFIQMIWNCNLLCPLETRAPYECSLDLGLIELGNIWHLKLGEHYWIRSLGVYLCGTDCA